MPNIIVMVIKYYLLSEDIVSFYHDGYWGYGRILKNLKTCVLRVRQTSVGEKCLRGCTSPKFGHFTV